MTQEQIIDGNKLIAEFMGLKQVKWDDGELLWVHKDFKEDFAGVHDYSDSSTFDWGNALPQTEKLFYHSSWDWLMSVVEKIEKDYWVTIVTRLTKTSCAVHKPHKGFEQISRGDSFSKIHAIWLMVVSFIKWYNSCQKEENSK